MCLIFEQRFSYKFFLINVYYQQGINTGNPDVVICTTEDIIAQYRIGVNGHWQTGNALSIEEGVDIYLRAQTPNNQYYITTPQENGPTFNSGGSESYVYKIDTGVFQGSNPKRNGGLIDISNVHNTFIELKKNTIYDLENF